MEDIYPAFHIHSDILGHAELPSLLKAEQRIEKAEKTLMQILQMAKTKFKVSGTMQGPPGTPAEKTVASVTFIKNFLRGLEYFNGEMRQVTDTITVLDCAVNFVKAADRSLKRIAWPGYICFTREKQDFELPSQFSIKYEVLLPVPQESTTFLFLFIYLFIFIYLFFKFFKFFKFFLFFYFVNYVPE